MKDPLKLVGGRCQCGAEADFILRASARDVLGPESTGSLMLSAPCKEHVGRSILAHADSPKYPVTVYEAVK